MIKEVITIPTRAKAPYSPGVRAGDYIFVSGQGGSVDAQGREVRGIEAQTSQCLENMKEVLEAAGASLDNVVKVTVFLADAGDFAKMNEVYQSYLPKDLPARSTVITALVRPDMLLEAECIAYCP